MNTKAFVLVLLSAFLMLLVGCNSYTNYENEPVAAPVDDVSQPAITKVDIVDERDWKAHKAESAELQAEIKEKDQMENANEELTKETEKSATCRLTGGEIVRNGWSGKDTGNNSCNQCMCMGAGLACTKMACPNVSSEHDR